MVSTSFEWDPDKTYVAPRVPADGSVIDHKRQSRIHGALVLVSGDVPESSYAMALPSHMRRKYDGLDTVVWMVPWMPPEATLGSARATLTVFSAAMKCWIVFS